MPSPFSRLDSFKSEDQLYFFQNPNSFKLKSRTEPELVKVCAKTTYEAILGSEAEEAKRRGSEAELSIKGF